MNGLVGFGGALNGFTKSHLLNLYIQDELKFNNGSDLISWDLKEDTNDNFVIERDGTDILTLTPSGDLTIIGSLNVDCIQDTDGTTKVCVADVTDVITMETNSLERMRIATDGSVGIGTNNPVCILDIEKNQNAKTQINIQNTNSGSSSTTEFLFKSDTSFINMGTLSSNFSTSGAFRQQGCFLGSGSNSGGLSIFTNSGNMRFYTGGNGDANERMVILNDGNVGIGVSPTTLLHISDTNPILTINNETAIYGGGTADIDFVGATTGTRGRIRSTDVSVGGAGPFESQLEFFTEDNNTLNQRMVLNRQGSLDIDGSYSIGSTSVLTTDTLGGGIFNSSLTNVGTLTSLTMGGDIAMGTNDITGATNITATNLTGTLQTAAQPNVTSASLTANTGNLTNTGTLTITDDLIVDTDTLFVDISTDRVGINTSTPATPLDVFFDGNVTVAHFLSNAVTGASVIKVENNTGVINTFGANGAGLALGGDSIAYIGTSSAHDVAFFRGNAEVMRFDTTDLKLSVANASVLNNSDVPLCGEIPYALYDRTTTQSIARIMAITLDWDSEVTDRGGFSESGGTITVPTEGLYLITWNVKWEVNSDGHRVTWLEYNGGEYGYVLNESDSSIFSGNSSSTILNMPSVLTFLIKVFHNHSTSSLNIHDTGNNLSIARIGNAI